MKQILVVDMLDGFTRNGQLASPRVAALLPAQAAFLSSLDHNDLVVFACDAHDVNDPEFQRFPAHCIKGTDEANICYELREAVDASGCVSRIVEKKTYCSFHETELDAIVDALPPDWIIIGCVTDICIEAAVAGMVRRNKSVTLVRNLIDTWDLSPETAAELALPETHIHPAGKINDYFFNHRFPAVWGCNIVERWQDL